MMYDWGYRHSGYDLWGFISTLVMMTVVILIIVLVVRQLMANNPHAHHTAGHMDRPKDALVILKERYAKGEIDKKEYLEKKKDLSE